MRRYRCYLARSFDLSETGVREYVQLQARNAEHAARLALATTGATSVIEVERLEEPSCA